MYSSSKTRKCLVESISSQIDKMLDGNIAWPPYALVVQRILRAQTVVEPLLQDNITILFLCLTPKRLPNSVNSKWFRDKVDDWRCRILADDQALCGAPHRAFFTHRCGGCAAPRRYGGAVSEWGGFYLLFEIGRVLVWREHVAGWKLQPVASCLIPSRKLKPPAWYRKWNITYNIFTRLFIVTLLIDRLICFGYSSPWVMLPTHRTCSYVAFCTGASIIYCEILQQFSNDMHAH